MSNQENSKMKKKEGGPEVALPKGRAPIISWLLPGKSRHTMNWRTRIHRLRATARPTAQHLQRLPGSPLSCQKQSSVPGVLFAFSPCRQGSSADVFDYASAPLQLLNRIALCVGRAWPDVASLPRPFHSTSSPRSAPVFIDKLSVGSVVQCLLDMALLGFMKDESGRTGFFNLLESSRSPPK